MKRLHVGSLQRALLLGFLALGVLVGAYFAFEYTLVAQVREAVAPPNTADPIAYGATLFQTRGCVGCHSFEPAGAVGDEGPNLTGIASRHDAAYIYQSIQMPGAVIAPQCPEGPCEQSMPNFGDILTDDQIDALVAYLSQP
ncbi:MAG: cytochrome c [Chloroflexota bacterium]|nr:cytochrome c [Chloroflexota bacterium]